jgi:hypothetical protein
MMLSPSGFGPPWTQAARSSNARFFIGIEPAVAGDAINALDKKILLPCLVNRTIQRPLEVNGHEQIARAVHGEERAVDLSVERDQFRVRPGGGPVRHVGLLHTDPVDVVLIVLVRGDGAGSPSAAKGRGPPLRSISMWAIARRLSV